MPHIDAAEFDYTPGLRSLRAVGGMEPQRSTFMPMDRRGSASFSIYGNGANGVDAGGCANTTHLGVTSSSPSYQHQRHAGHSPPPNNTIVSATSQSTLIWTDLEPWMDEEYAKQVCALMGWEPISIKIPHPVPDATAGQLANNSGYCFLTFPSQAHAANVITSVSANPPIAMPNSVKPFSMSWASAIPSATSSTQPASFAPSATPTAHQPYSKEFSIFVGDLAPETSNSDLVAVFRNPVLGLRNDREPKFIRPFLSCKSAKIMLDPVTGVSRGYGFVRFSDEADQQRALIEMHGLYCLSRPMRISPATAKSKLAQAPTMTPQELAQLQHYVGSDVPTDPITTVTLAPQVKSVSASVAQPTSPTNAAMSTTSSGSASSLTSSSSLDTGSSTSVATAGSIESKLYDSNAKSTTSNSYAQEHPRLPMDYNPAIGSTAANRYMISEESWKHHIQARAILGNLIGPNGEQLTSTDPYNTTVFVGGLSPLIQEETLRTFFAPFGDIHYVKVPVGKHCGFVQFVRKADAERAIEKMQGFPIGGSRIRLSWGRSQYKAAQAAAQAAQAAAMQSQVQHQNRFNIAMQASLPSDIPPTVNDGQLTQDQAIQLLQKLSQQGYLDPNFTLASSTSSNPSHVMNGSGGISYANQGVTSNGHGALALERMFISPSPTTGLYSEEKLRTAHLSGREDLIGTSSYDGRFDLQTFAAQHQQQHRGQQPSPQYQQDNSSSGRPATSFSPFSPDPNALYVQQNEAKNREFFRLASMRHGANAEELTDSGRSGNAVSSRPSSARYENYQGLVPKRGSGSTGTSPVNRVPVPAPISRPSSGQPAAPRDPFDMHDMNGTLTSLDLGEVSFPSGGKSNRDSRLWGLKSPGGSSDSGASSVQFQITRDDGISS